MSDIIIRQLTNNIWIFSRPYIYKGLPMGGRSTAIKLNNGGVWVLASTPLTPETKARLDQMGPVQYIMAPNQYHHMFLGDFKEAYPAAKLIAPKETIGQHGDPNLKFDGVWGVDPADTKYGFEDEIKACFFPGHKNKDVAFFHIASRTLIVADLFLNFPSTEQFSQTSHSGKFPIVGNIGFKFARSTVHNSYIVDKSTAGRDVKTVASWDFDRLIPCHGDVIDTGAKKEWQSVYKSLLKA